MISNFQFLKLIQLEKNVGLMGLDIGSGFIGIGIAKDAFGKGYPCPVSTLDRRKCDISREIEKLVGGIHGIVVGFTKVNNPNGEVVKNTVSMLSKHIKVPFVMMNEDYSTVKAADLLYQICPRYAKSKYLLDQVAACVILQRFIDESKEKIIKL